MAYLWKSGLFLAIFGFYTAHVFGASDTQKIIANVMSGYDHLSPPVPSFNESVLVKLGISLNKIQRVNEDSNSISLMTWLKMEFIDHRLTWDPANYSGIDTIRVPFQRVWLPDIVLYNGLSGSQYFEDKIMAMVKSNGRVYAIPPMLVTASCDMDLAFFPFDVQTCQLKYGSWTYDISVIDLQPMDGKVDLSNYMENPEWHLANTTLELNEKKYDCCEETYSDITITLELERRAGPYSVKLVIPSVLTAFLILFTFILPSSSGEKIVFCLVLLLSLILLSVYLHISVPSNSESILGEFLTFGLFLDFFATIIAVICYNVADALLMRDKLGGPESEKHWAARKRKLKILRIMEYVFFALFLIIFIIGTAVILCRRG